MAGIRRLLLLPHEYLRRRAGPAGSAVARWLGADGRRCWLDSGLIETDVRCWTALQRSVGGTHFAAQAAGRWHALLRRAQRTVWFRDGLLCAVVDLGRERLLPIPRLAALCACRWQLGAYG